MLTHKLSHPHNRPQEAGVFTCLEGGIEEEGGEGKQAQKAVGGGRKLDVNRGENRDGRDGGRDDER